jgi:hypothetical protein
MRVLALGCMGLPIFLAQSCGRFKQAEAFPLTQAECFVLQAAIELGWHRLLRGVGALFALFCSQSDASALDARVRPQRICMSAFATAHLAYACNMSAF